MKKAKKLRTEEAGNNQEVQELFKQIAANISLTQRNKQPSNKWHGKCPLCGDIFTFDLEALSFSCGKCSFSGKTYADFLQGMESKTKEPIKEEPPKKRKPRKKNTSVASNGE